MREGREEMGVECAAADEALARWLLVVDEHLGIRSSDRPSGLTMVRLGAAVAGDV